MKTARKHCGVSFLLKKIQNPQQPECIAPHRTTTHFHWWVAWTASWNGAHRTGNLYVTENTALHLKQYTKICFWKTFKERETTNWMVVHIWLAQPVLDLGFSASSFTAQKQYGGHFHLTDSQLQLNNRCNLLNLLLCRSAFPGDTEAAVSSIDFDFTQFSFCKFKCSVPVNDGPHTESVRAWKIFN